MAWRFGTAYNFYTDADKEKVFTQVTPVTNSGFLGLSAGNGLNGGYSLRMGCGSGVSNSGSGTIRKTVAASGSRAMKGIWYRSVTDFNSFATGTNPDAAIALFGGACVLLAISKSGSTLCWLRPNSNGTLSVYRGSTVLGTTTFALTQNVFAFIELDVTLHGSAGTVDLYVNEVNVLHLTGQNTTNTGDTTWDEFRHGPICNSGANQTTHDFGMTLSYDGSGTTWNTPQGIVLATTRFVNADGNYAQSTPSTGADRKATIDEAQANGDTDYNTLAGAGDRDSFQFLGPAVAGSTILGAQLTAQSRAAAAGTAKEKLFARIGGTDYDGDEHALSTTYSFNQQFWAAKPSDDTPFEDADFPAEFGYLKSS